jgi:hypothetical protein
VVDSHSLIALSSAAEIEAQWKLGAVILGTSLTIGVTFLGFVAWNMKKGNGLLQNVAFLQTKHTSLGNEYLKHCACCCGWWP